VKANWLQMFAVIVLVLSTPCCAGGVEEETPSSSWDEFWSQRCGRSLRLGNLSHF